MSKRKRHIANPDDTQIFKHTVIILKKNFKFVSLSVFMILHADA